MTALLIIVYLTAGAGGNMTVTQFDVRPTQVFSSAQACAAAQAAVVAWAIANMRVDAVCIAL
jgi:hypothetical protein